MNVSTLCKSIPLALACLTLSACVTANIGQDFGTDKVCQMRAGESTQADVARLFGAPLGKIEIADWKIPRYHFGDESTVTIWRYLQASGSLGGSSSKTLQVEFDAAGHVVDYSFLAISSKGKKTKTTDYDIHLAREQLVPGTSTRADVIALLGTNSIVVPFNKAGVAERLEYGYTETSKTEWTEMFGRRIQRIYGKSLSIQLDSEGRVVSIRGVSDFPEDIARQAAPTK
jgi:outer membrane protein assembly factor BamE (lipoprotein component of BamABCDE complex)